MLAMVEPVCCSPYPPSSLSTPSSHSTRSSQQPINTTNTMSCSSQMSFTTTHTSSSVTTNNVVICPAPGDPTASKMTSMFHVGSFDECPGSPKTNRSILTMEDNDHQFDNTSNSINQQLLNGAVTNSECNDEMYRGVTGQDECNNIAEFLLEVGDESQASDSCENACNSDTEEDCNCSSSNLTPVVTVNLNHTPSKTLEGTCVALNVPAANVTSTTTTTKITPDSMVLANEGETKTKHCGQVDCPKHQSRRSGSASALKCPRGKSPFKSVSFADNNGHTLTQVLSFESFEELDFTVSESPPVYHGARNLSTETFAPLFFLPPTNQAFIDKVVDQKVKLELVHIVGTNVVGSVLVANLGFNKDVCLRYTLNQWKCFVDTTTTHVPGSTNKGVDRFSFEMKIPAYAIKDRVDFCVRYLCDEGEFWDNNNGANYVLRLLKH